MAEPAIPQSAQTSEMETRPTIVELRKALSEFDVDSPMSDSELEKFSNLMLQLAREDPAGAVALMSEWEGFSPEGLRDYLFEEVVRTAPTEVLGVVVNQVLADRNTSDAARANAQAILKGIAFQGRETEMASELRAFFTSNPGQEFVSLFFESISPLRSQRLIEILPEFGIHGRSAIDAKRAIAFGLRIENPQQALEIASSIDAAYTGGFYGELFLDWMMRDPVSAKAELLKLEPGELRVALSRQGLVDLISQDRTLVDGVITQIPLTESYTPVFQSWISNLSQDDAIQVLQNFPPSEARGRLVETALADVSPADARELGAVLEQMPASLRNEASRALIRKLSLESPSEALAYIKGSPDAATKSVLFNEMIESTSRRSAESAARLFDDQSSSLLVAADRASLASSIVENWAAYDLDAALGWATKLPSVDGAQPVRKAFDIWVKTDPVKFSGWIEEQPPSDSRDSAIRSLISELETASPESVPAWRMMLSEPHQE